MSARHPKPIRAIQLALLGVVGCLVAACGYVPYSTPVAPPPGGIFADIKAPLTTNVNGSKATINLKKSSQKKTQFFHNPIYIPLDFGWGEADIASIAKQGGITEVVYADYELFNVLGVYAEFTINVYGN